MAGAMRKMAVYLGLVEDEEHDHYDDYDDDGEVATVRRYDDAPSRNGVRAYDDSPSTGYPARVRPTPVVPEQPVDSSRITTLHPRTYNEARTIGEHYRDGTPVIMNLTEMDDTDAKRIVDFAAGLVFGCHGTIERVTNKVFLLSPANVDVAAEAKRLAQDGFFNQS